MHKQLKNKNHVQVSSWKIKFWKRKTGSKENGKRSRLVIRFPSYLYLSSASWKLLAVFLKEDQVITRITHIIHLLEFSKDTWSEWLAPLLVESLEKNKNKEYTLTYEYFINQNKQIKMRMNVQRKKRLWMLTWLYLLISPMQFRPSFPFSLQVI